MALLGRSRESMMMWKGICVSLVAVGLLGSASLAHAQVFVEPRRAFKGPVHHFDFAWQYIDILGHVEPPAVPLSVGESSAFRAAGNSPATSTAASESELASPPASEFASAAPARAAGAGVRLYFYLREVQAAERAGAFVAEAYDYLAARFDYVPQRRFEYFLYSTYQEFLETNLFPLSEGVLGVTSPADLKLTLPYLGDHVLFEQVSTHELTHQFMIQKVATRAKETKAQGDPLDAFPLWFMEGLAEYYAHHGIDPETEMVARDLVVNPDIERGYALLDFFDDAPYRFGNGPFVVTWTYKIGQMRVAFLEETYGDGTVQRLIDNAPLLVGLGDLLGGGERGLDFKKLVEKVTGDDARTVAEHFEEWQKRRAYASYLAGSETIPTLPGIREPGLLNALAASPNGDLLLYRAMSLETGQTELLLVDPLVPDYSKVVAADGSPGLESLHPVFARNFDLGQSVLVFVAESGGADVLYWQGYTHTTEPRPASPQQERPDHRVATRRPAGSSRRRADLPPRIESQSPWRAHITLGERQGLELAPFHLIAAESPALSPDQTRVAFVGIDEQGVRDVYVVELRREGTRLVKVTDDVWGERGVSWGPRGIYYTSDATAHGKYNLFVVQPDGSARERLTTAARDAMEPRALADGRVYFSAYENGHADVHEVVDGKVVRRTGIGTGLFDVSPGPDGGLWALWHRGGERVPARLLRQDLVDYGADEAPPPDEPRLLATHSLQGATPYLSLAPQNWQLGNLMGFLGAGSGVIFGQVMATASDRLRDHYLLLNVSIYGRPELSQGSLLYINQEKWVSGGGGLFQDLQFRLDRTFGNDVRPFVAVERFFGGLVTARYPFNSFQYAEADVALGGVKRFLDTPEQRLLADPIANYAGRDLRPDWEVANHGTRPQGEVAVRLGHDTMRYNPFTGPFDGSSLLLEGTLTTQPLHGGVFGSVRLDAAHYFHLIGSANLATRVGLGTAQGGPLARQFLLQSFDTLRGVDFGTTSFLLGRAFYFSTVELQFPLTSIVRVVFLPNIEGVIGLDFGAAGDNETELIEKRVLDLALGTNFVVGPLVMRLHFARPINTSARPDKVGLTAPSTTRWVTNFSINWLYF